MTTLGRPRLQSRSGLRCVLTVASSGFSGADRLSFQLSSWSSGFSPPRCYQASSALSHQYHPWICHPLHPAPLRGRLGDARFMKSPATWNLSAGGLHWVRHTSLPVYRPTSQRFRSPDIRTRLVTPARPRPLCHLVGSLFATYTGSASCFLQTIHFW